ncbi:MAG: 50S ribosomal protein L25 [Candidatus Omnitrophica bacterium]|nr:50S ribosomal protein L25 [Candidatus Omnitrophota bacterium]
MEKVILKAEVREETGKRVAKDLRNKGLVPANVYRSGKAATSLTVADKELRGVLHTKAGENVLITLKVSGGESSAKDRTVLIKEIQRHPVRDSILHVDFNEISLTEVLEVNVPLVARGEPAGVKIDGGLLEHVLRELSVECLPTDIPAKIEVDVSALKIGEHILVKDIKVPEGVKVLNDPELIALIVKAPKVEAPKEEAVAGGEEPELIRKKKEEAAVEGEEPKEAPVAAKEPKKEEKK